MAEAIITNVTLQIILQAIEELQSVPGAEGSTINNDQFNRSENFSPSSTVPMSRCSYQTITMGGGGTSDIDLTALPGSQSTIDGTGKKLQALYVRNRGAASVNVAPGASNAYSPYGAGNDIDIPAGAENLHLVRDTLADVAAGVKNIRLTGTAADEYDVIILLG